MVAIWIFTKFGFFSVTEVRDYSSESKSPYFKVPPLPVQPPGTLQVRARIRGDLDELRRRYMPTLSETFEIAGRDYPYRAFATKEAVASAMYYAAMDIDYGNFKNEVMAEQGLPREMLYADVWQVMFQAERKLKDKEAQHRRYEREKARRDSAKSRTFRWEDYAAWLRSDPEDDDPAVTSFPPQEDPGFLSEEEVSEESFSLLRDPELERAVFTWGEDSGATVRRKRRRRRKGRRD